MVALPPLPIRTILLLAAWVLRAVSATQSKPVCRVIGLPSASLTLAEVQTRWSSAKYSAIWSTGAFSAKPFNTLTALPKFLCLAKACPLSVGGQVREMTFRQHYGQHRGQHGG